MQQGGGSILPPEYQQVKYLRGGGDAYIVLPYRANNKTRVKIIARPVTDINEYNGQLCGSIANIYTAFTLFPAPRQNNRFSNHSFMWPDEYLIPNTIYSFDMSANGTYMNNVLKGTFGAVSAFVAGNDFTLYRANGSPDLGAIWDYFEFILEEDGVELYNLVLCYRKADNKGGMYDIINNEFHTSAGTGEFIVGPDVN